MTTPLILDSDDSDLIWKKLDRKKQENYNAQKSQDVISADADSLLYDDYYSRLASIRDSSNSATSGAIAADNTRKQYEAAVKAAEISRQQALAQQQAYNGMNQIAAGGQFGQPIYGMPGGGASGWGSGGAQGVANVLKQAGFPDSAIPTMGAIAFAESSWNPNATHANAGGRYGGTVDQGLFQINTMHRGESWYPSNPFDPLQSAKAAYALWSRSGGKFTDWSVYNSGLYRQHLSKMQGITPNVGQLQPYVANTGAAGGLRNAIVGSANSFAGVPAAYNGGNYGPANYSGLAGNAAAARDYVQRTFPGVSSIGGFGGGSVSGSDHPRGKAIDIMISNYRSNQGITNGTNIANWFIQNPRAFGVKYIIWRDRIWQNGVWKPYGHPTMHNDTGQHRDHVHVSFL